MKILPVFAANAGNTWKRKPRKRAWTAALNEKMAILSAAFADINSLTRLNLPRQLLWLTTIAPREAKMLIIT